MIKTAWQIKRMEIGSPASLVLNQHPEKKIEGHIVRSGKKKVFRAVLSGTLHQIVDREGWHWEA